MSEKTRKLYAPLYDRAMVSRSGIILSDPKAEEIWSERTVPAGMRCRSKLNAYIAAMCGRVIDDWVRDNALNTVINIGCGLDSRVQRIGLESHYWFDVDSPENIEERREHYRESSTYKMLAADMTETGWLDRIQWGGDVTVIAEGAEKFLTDARMGELTEALTSKFTEIRLITDMTFSSPKLRMTGEFSAAPEKLIAELSASDQRVIRLRNVQMRRLFEYRNR